MVAIGECIVGVTIGCLWGYVRSLDGILTELYNLVNNVPMVIYMTLIALVVGQSFRIMGSSGGLPSGSFREGRIQSQYPSRSTVVLLPSLRPPYMTF